ncbi:MAG: putative TIM-barrel fold metal-dependent hydrolase [Halieaceae bacterium]|jgi:predicted TIM-barrel fold metal-dependent hydrolase
MSDRVLIVSSDCHAGLPIAQYKPYIETRFHDVMDVAVPIQIEQTQKAEASFLIQEINEEWRKGIKQELTGAWDYAERVKMLDNDGIAAEVIFPDGITELNTPPFGAGLSLPTKDIVPELQWAGAMAHNRWLSEFCANNPVRHRGVAIIPLLWDVDLAVKNVRWCAENGLYAAMIPVMTDGFSGYHHRKYDPFWEACEELGVMISFHSGPGAMADIFGQNWPDESAEDSPGAMGIYVSEVLWWLYRPLAFMIWGGVFERYPGLRATLTEGGTTWMIPAWLRMLDHHYTDTHHSAKLGDFRSHLSMKPSGYFQRNIAVGASCVPRKDIEDRAQIGTNKMMWGSDYPHPEGTWPSTAQFLVENFSGFPEADVRAILGGNALEWYGLDEACLSEIAQRIGPPISSFQ